MGWNDRLDRDPMLCDECEDCENECIQHEEVCDMCGHYPCACDVMYESWKDEQAAIYEDD